MEPEVAPCWIKQKRRLRRNRWYHREEAVISVILQEAEAVVEEEAVAHWVGTSSARVPRDTVSWPLCLVVITSTSIRIRRRRRRRA